MKYRFSPFFSWFLLLSVGVSSINCADDFDDIGDVDSTPHHHVEYTTRQGKDVTLGVLTGFNAHKALLTEVYRRTHQPISRSPHDLPITQVFKINFNDQTSLKVAPFISSVTSQSFTPQSTELKSYLNLELPDIIQIIDDVEFVNFDLLDILNLFHAIKVQEHTAGFMFHWIKSSDDWAYSIAVPVSYVLNNFYLTSEEQKRIANHPTFAQFNGDVMDFVRKHCMSDRFGLGDTQLTIERLMHDTYRGSYSLGAQLTIPTGFAWKKGLMGTHFNSQLPPDNIDVYSDVIDPFLSGAENAAIQKRLSDFGYATMDRLATILLEKTMGNNYHWAIGGFMRSQLNFNDKFSLVSKTVFDIKLPAISKRFFLVEQTQDEFNKFKWDDNTVQVNEKIDYINTQVKNIFFPQMYFSTVFPGFTFHSTSCLKRHVDAGRWSASIGSDTWFNSAERFLDINAPAEVLSHINEKKYRRTGALSSSIWIALERAAYERSPWSFSYKTYLSFMNAGFGNALGATFSFEREF